MAYQLKPAIKNILKNLLLLVISAVITLVIVGTAVTFIGLDKRVTFLEQAQVTPVVTIQPTATPSATLAPTKALFKPTVKTIVPSK